MLTDDVGRPRVVVTQRTFGELLELVVSQLCSYGIGDARVAGRLVTLLEDVSWNDPEQRFGADVVAGARRVLRALSSSDLDPVDLKDLSDRSRAVIAGHGDEVQPAHQNRQKDPLSGG